jgi:hypothetical protein
MISMALYIEHKETTTEATIVNIYRYTRYGARHVAGHRFLCITT